MGTRHAQYVINKEGEEKVAQYGQWDGYPSGQGVDILKFLQENDLEKYLENVNKLKELDDENAERINKWLKELDNKNLNYEDERKEMENNPEYFALSRDCGSRLHKMILDGNVKFIQLLPKEEADSWCAGFYTINFQTNEFIAEFGGIKKRYSLDNLPTVEQFLFDFKSEDDE